MPVILHSLFPYFACAALAVSLAGLFSSVYMMAVCFNPPKMAASLISLFGGASVLLYSVPVSWFL
jgi:hypothetical protein